MPEAYYTQYAIDGQTPQAVFGKDQERRKNMNRTEKMELFILVQTPFGESLDAHTAPSD